MNPTYRPRPASPRRARPARPGAEALERRALLANAYAPVVADYDGDGVADVAALRTDVVGSTQVYGRNALLMQQSKTGTFTGFEMGASANDRPVAGDFDGDGKADPAVYGFQDNVSYGNYYGTTTAAGVAQPFPDGSGRFAYIPSSGNYPNHTPGRVNGTMGLDFAKVVVVNIGTQGDIPAVADYDGDGKDDFAVYEPSKAQFLYYASSTFDPDADPSLPANAPHVLPLGKPGDVPAPADYLGTGHAQFAVYDAASGTFFVQPPNGGAVVTVQLGGPGSVPASGDYQGTGRAQYAVYDPTKAAFFLRAADGSGVYRFAVGAAGDAPVPGRFGDGHEDFATYTAATGQFHILGAAGVATTKSLVDPDAIPIKRTDDYTVATHAGYVARTGDPDVMFLGDSITYFWPTIGADSWQGRIQPEGAVNNGVVYDTTQNLLWRITNGELKGTPKVVVLAIGTNDLSDRTPAQVAHTVWAIENAIHAYSPSTSILLVGILPRGEDSPAATPDVRAYNADIEAKVRDYDQNYLPLLARPFASRSTAGYPTGNYSVDLRATFAANGGDPNNYYAVPGLFRDLLHPNQYGYQYFASALATPLRLMLGQPAVAADYDGDRRSDLSIYAPNAATFALLLSSSGTTAASPFGAPGAGRSLPAPGDYDGDGRADQAVYLPAAGAFAYRPSGGGADRVIPFGIPGAGQSLPAPGDYDGDGKTDLAVYLPALGAFAYRPSGGGADVLKPFGIPGAGQSIPAPGDYDGDGKTDLAVYLPALGEFAYRPSTGGADRVVPFGIPGPGQSDPAPGDYDGDGKTDLAVYLPALGTYAYRPSGGGKDVVVPLGVAGANQSIPAPGDYDGDGKTDLAVYEAVAGRFAVRQSGTGATLTIPYGIAGLGQSLPTTGLDALMANGYGAAPPAAVAPPATAVASKPTRKPAKVGRATPAGPQLARQHASGTAPGAKHRA